MIFDDWKTYLPSYRFPTFLRTCFGCLAILMVGSSILVFLVLPSIFSYINSLDETAIVDVPLGSFVDLGSYRLYLLAIENDNLCARGASCAATIRFRETLDDSEYTIQYIEDRPISDGISLPEGYMVRILQVSPDSAFESDLYTVRLQIFQPPEE